MKKCIVCAICAIVLAGIACHFCCHSRSRIWYPIEGGYVNLSNVTTIRATGRLALYSTVTEESKDLLGRPKQNSRVSEVAVLLDGPITAESVAAAKAKLAEAAEWDSAKGGASLHLDRISVPFAPVPAEADAAAVSALLDDWLKKAKSIDCRVK